MFGCNKKKQYVVKETDELVEMFEEGETFIVYAGTSDCGHCKEFKEVIDEVLKNYPDLTIYYFSADNYETKEVQNVIYNYLYKLEYTPTIYYVQNGRTLDYEDETLDYDGVVSWLKKHGYIEY